jgi:hypothetical protein
MTPSIPTRSEILDLVVTLCDDANDAELDEIPYADVESASIGIGLSVPTPVIRMVRELGFLVGPRGAGPTRTRGYRSSSNDRWFGPGSSPTCGGSGGDSITGMAGQVEY